MSAFEELGVMPELIRGVQELGWLLPTPIQAEAVPLILGGGDVMVAAETGSGKTGAFALPVLQAVHEALVARRRAADGPLATPAAPTEPTAPSTAVAPEQAAACLVDVEDRDAIVAVSPDGLACQARSHDCWGGARATAGAVAGKVYYEATVSDEGLCRVGWAARASSLNIGTDRSSFGYGGTGQKSHGKKFEQYGEAYGLHDTIGCLLDLDAGELGFAKNGRALGAAFAVPKHLRGQPLHPAFCLKNAQLALNFGGAPFAHAPPPGYVGLDQAPGGSVVRARAAPPPSAPAACTPLAIVLEPTQELAEQTLANMELFGKHLGGPAVRAGLFVGSLPAAPQLRTLAEGVDVVVGTPGRVAELIDKGRLAVDAVQFFVLDEADRLLDAGGREAVLRIFRQLPKAGAGVSRLQVLLFSATLHSPGVRALSAQICENPILVDLKGREAVPESVVHVAVHVDPREDRTWLQSEPAVPTDGVHSVDPALGPNCSTPEAWSEAVKRLKPRLLVRLADALRMQRALVFCRTNHDCDNLEAFLNALGGGGEPADAAPVAPARGRPRKRGRAPDGPYSCIVLAGARSAEERRAALQAFKDGDARFLACTDVAARGLDVRGLPFVVNMTLPDKTEDYIHRVGRVGRAECHGLAVSLVSAVPEKVWYCRDRGARPWLAPDADNTREREAGGHAAWIEERERLAAVETRLGAPVQALSPELALPPGVAARVAGGGGAGGEAPAYVAEVAARVAAERPAVLELAELEKQAQLAFFALRLRWGGQGQGGSG